MKEVITFITILLNFLIAFVVYKRNPRSHTHVLIALFIFFAILWTVTNYFSLSTPFAQERLFWVRMVMIVTTPVPSVFLLLAKVFPESQLHAKKRTLYSLLFFNLALCVLAFTPYMFSSYFFVNDKPVLEHGPAIFLYGAYFFVTSARAVQIFINKSRYKKGREKAQAQYVLLGLSLTIFLGLTTNYIMVVFFHNLETVFLGPLFTFFLIFSLAYAIIKLRFMDIRIVILKSLLFSFFVVALGLFHSSIVFFIQSFFRSHQQQQLQFINSFFVTVFAVLTFPVIKELAFKSFSRFFPELYPNFPQHLHDMNKLIASHLVLEGLFTQLHSQLTQAVQTDHVTLFLQQKKKNIFFTSSNASDHEQKKDLEALCQHVFRSSLFSHQVFVVDEEVLNQKARNLCKKLRISVLVPLIFQKEMLGILLLGERKNGDIYTVEQLQFLELLAVPLSLAIKNAVSYNQIQQFNQILKKEVAFATHKLKKTNQQLRELDHLKDEFVAMASHQLKTPLTIIKNAIWFVLYQEETPLTPHITHYLDTAYSSTERLISLVKDILTISKIEGRNFPLHKTAFSLQEIVDDIHAEFLNKITEKQVKFFVEVSSQDSYIIYGDKAKIREALQNLIDNAIKFTPLHGEIRVSLAKKQETSVVEVKDSGPGISAEDQKKLFKKFNRLDHSYVYTPETGTGLGLYITKQIIVAHKGKIFVRSQKGETAFQVVLPSNYHAVEAHAH